MARPLLTFFTRRNCMLCDKAFAAVQNVRKEVEFQQKVVDIDLPEHVDWSNKYMFDIPVVHINGVEHTRHAVDEKKLRAALTLAIKDGK